MIADLATSVVVPQRTQRGPARLWIAVATLILIALVIGSLGIGRYPISLGTVARVLATLLTGGNGQSGAWTDTEWIVIATVRLPRVLVAMFAGIGLGLSGAAVQGVFRNPLAGPQVLGISHGAAWGGVIAVLIAANAVTTVGLAFSFALIALVFVFLLNRLSGSNNVLAIVLAGVIVSAFFSALVGLAEFLADPQRQLPGIVYWLLGSFAAVSGRSAWIIAVPTILAGALLIGLRWRINILSLGETDATALGIDVARLRWGILGLVTLLVAAQVSVSGAIGWVGLVVPHLARRLVGPRHEDVLPLSALLGALLLLGIDDVARTIVAQEIPIGVLTALVGTPVFAGVFWKSQQRGWARD
ncbi:MAG TPA: iron ABC transporter permease [Gemmatimonadaceae bacterium]|jgi:iron complex transport system permease protein